WKIGESLRDADTQRRNLTYAVFDLREISVMLRVGQIAPREEIKLVGAINPILAALTHCSIAPTLDMLQELTGRCCIHRLTRIEMRELSESNWYKGFGKNGFSQIPKITERLFQHRSVVQPRNDDHLAVKANAAIGEPGELVNNVRNAWIVEQHLSRFPVCGVHGDVERREAILENSGDVLFLRVRQRREIPVGERETVVVVA